MTANAVAFVDVAKRFGAVAAVDGISFEIAGGETVALLGPSGCGKTTVLRLIAGFETPDAGSVRIDGTETRQQRPYQRNVGLLFQHYALFPHMSVAENVAYGLRHRGFARADIPRRVTEMLELVKLPLLAERRPSQLSGGQQQRVALARALATQPGVVLLDEPLSALDAKLRQELRAELKTMLAAVGSTVIVVTHDQEEAMSLGERIFVMRAGRIVQHGAPAEIYARPRSRFVAEFMGRSNWFAGRIIGSDADGATFATRCGLTLRAAPHLASISAEHDLCIRPEAIDVLPGTAAHATNQAAGRVVDVALLGATRQLAVELDGGSRLLVVQPNRAGDSPEAGQSVTLALPAHACMLVPAEPSA